MSIVSKNYNIYVRNSDLGSNVNLIVNFVNVLCTTPKAINLDTHTQIKPESTNTWEEGGFNGIHQFDNYLLLGTLSAYLHCYLCIKIKPIPKRTSTHPVNSIMQCAFVRDKWIFHLIFSWHYLWLKLHFVKSFYEIVVLIFYILVHMKYMR